MKFLCDVHISYQLKKHLITLGFESIHVNEILERSETKDSSLRKYADQHRFVMITKDSDFRDSYFLKKSPKKLIKINLGNISNKELIQIFEKNIEFIKGLEPKDNFMLEIDKDNIDLIEL